MLLGTLEVLLGSSEMKLLKIPSFTYDNLSFADLHLFSGVVEVKQSCWSIASRTVKPAAVHAFFRLYSFLGSCLLQALLLE